MAKKYEKCRIEGDRIVCKDNEEDEEKPKVSKKESRCTTLTDKTTKEKVEVCTKDGKPTTARRIAGEFGETSDD